jgi:hypothetical protein
LDRNSLRHRIRGRAAGRHIFFLGLDLFEFWTRPLIALWIAAPLPLAYWLGVRLARGRLAFAIVLAAMLVAFVFSAWAYWEITWGESRQTESMSGLLFLFGPLYQYALLAIALLIAWLTGLKERAG